jgi:hypothetical protein
MEVRKRREMRGEVQCLSTGLYANAARINQLPVPMMATSGIFPIQSEAIPIISGLKKGL